MIGWSLPNDAKTVQTFIVFVPIVVHFKEVLTNTNYIITVVSILFLKKNIFFCLNKRRKTSKKCENTSLKQVSFYRQVQSTLPSKVKKVDNKFLIFTDKILRFVIQNAMFYRTKPNGRKKMLTFLVSGLFHNYEKTCSPRSCYTSGKNKLRCSHSRYASRLSSSTHLSF